MERMARVKCLVKNCDIVIEDPPAVAMEAAGIVNYLCGKHIGELALGYKLTLVVRWTPDERRGFIAGVGNEGTS